MAKKRSTKKKAAVKARTAKQKVKKAVKKVAKKKTVKSRKAKKPVIARKVKVKKAKKVSQATKTRKSAIAKKTKARKAMPKAVATAKPKPRPIAMERLAQKKHQKPGKRGVRLMMPDASGRKPVGVVTHYYDRIGVGVLKLAEPIRVGDMIRVRRGMNEFTQIVRSMQINRQPVQLAKANDDVALKVDKPAHEGARVYKA